MVNILYYKLTMHFIANPISSLNHLLARLATDQITLFSSAIFFLVLSFTYKIPFWQEVDKKVFNYSINSANNFLKKHARDYAFLGNAIFHIFFSIVLAVLFFIIKHKIAISISILFTLIFSWGFNRFLKLIFRRQRPEQVINGVHKRMSFCFPSGHVMASISIYFFSGMILQNLIPYIPWYIFSSIISFLVIASRIYLNHHYFTDVLGGIFMGIFCLNISLWIYFLLMISSMLSS